MNIYEKIGLQKVINASGRMTILGVSVLSDKSTDGFKEGSQNFVVMEDLMNKAGEISKFSLEDLTARLKQNGLLFRESDKVLIENFDFEENNVKQITYFGTIKSINIDNKTYTLEEYEDVEFEDEYFYDGATC